ncbi:MAG TPA: ABC transporter ATP-binding protein [Ktedonobacteraceae bacterium]|nr:ABC transporter ATP-binding protein [Ktedonobacteraceae bacterium]
MQQESPAVEVEHLRKVYHQLVAVDDVSFVMHRGEAFGFLGPNGAGKSTIVKIITGLVKPTEGTVRVLGRAIDDMEMRRRVGYLPELPNFHRWLRAQEFLEFHGRLYGLYGAALVKRCAEVLALVGLEGREKQKLGAFSKGMLQRIGLAQALLNRPDLIILDEPVSGLDPVGQSDMRNILLRLKSEGTSVFLNSHQLVDVEAVCDRVAIINRGKLLKIGPPQSLFDEPLTLELHVDCVSDELLHRLGALTLAVREVEDQPRHLLVEVQNEEQAADVAATVHACGARLYMMTPHGRSLEDLFLRTIGELHHGQ